MNYYPAFLNLQNKKAVVIGGGKVAERKILSLLKAGADITVISPTLTKRLQKAKDHDKFRHIPRSYGKKDLKHALLVIAATDSHATNVRVSEAAPALVNVVDVPSLCNFIAPSAIQRGPLTIAVSTGGASPALSKAVRKELEKLYGTGFSGYLTFIRQIRAKVIAQIPEKRKRETFLKGLATEKIFNALRSNGLKYVKKQVRDNLSRLTRE